MPHFNRIHRPPEPQDIDLHEVWAAIQIEAERQFGLFREEGDRAAQERAITVMESGICNMILRGAARVEDDGTIVFWNPVEGGFQEYDEEYNALMLEFMQSVVGASR